MLHQMVYKLIKDAACSLFLEVVQPLLPFHLRLVCCIKGIHDGPVLVCLLHVDLGPHIITTGVLSEEDDALCGGEFIILWLLRNGLLLLLLLVPLLLLLLLLMVLLMVLLMSHQLERWLRTECVLPWHVEIIDEADSLLLGVLRSVLVLCSSLEVALKDLLSVDG